MMGNSSIKLFSIGGGGKRSPFDDLIGSNWNVWIYWVLMWTQRSPHLVPHRYERLFYIRGGDKVAIFETIL